MNEQASLLAAASKTRLAELTRRLTDLPTIREVHLDEGPAGLTATVRPDLAQVWATGSANVETVIRVTLIDALRAAGEMRPIVDLVITQSPVTPDCDDRTEPHPDVQIYGPDDPIGHSIWNYLQERFPGRAMQPDWCPRLELGLDSLAWLELLIEVEAHIGFGLPELVSAEIITLGDLVAAFRSASKSPKDNQRTLTEARDWFLQAPENCRSLARRPMLLKVIGYAIYLLNWAILHSVFRLTVSGIEHLPTSGAFILAPNHASDLDIPAVLATIPIRQLPRFCWGGNRERLFNTRIGRFFCWITHVIPLDDRLPVVAISTGVAVLRSGRPLVWYPEAWRAADGRVQPLLRGIGVLAAETGVSIVPVRITGTFEAWPRSRRLPRPHRVSIDIAPPMTLAALESRGDGDDRAARIAHGLWRVMRERDHTPIGSLAVQARA